MDVVPDTPPEEEMSDKLPPNAGGAQGEGGEEGEEEEGDFSEWQQLGEGEEGADEAEEDPAFCLFCPLQFPSADDVLAHCRGAHGFDFLGCKSERQLDFYSCIKAVNYLRSQVSQSVCPVCCEHLPSTSLLESHMRQRGHCGLPSDSSLFSGDQYLKTVLESDPLLYSIEWGEGEEDGEGEQGGGEGGDVEMEIAQLAGVQGTPAGQLAASSAAPGSGVPGATDSQGDFAMGAGERVGGGSEAPWREGAGGLAGWLGERVGGGEDGESDAGNELSSNSQLASEVILLRRQNAELAIQLTQIQAEVAASALSGGTPFGTSRISAPSTPSRSPPVPQTPVNTPVHSSSPRHTNPATLGAAFGAPGVAAGLSLGLRLKQREAQFQAQGQSPGVPPAAPSSLQDLQVVRSAQGAQDHPATGGFPPLHPGLGAPGGVPRPLPAGALSPAWGTPDRAPPTPFSTPVVSPSPSSSYLPATFSAAAAAAALETVAALGQGFSLTGSETPSPGPSASGTPRKTPRTPVSTPAMSPVPGYGGFAMTAADAQAAAAILAAWAERRSGRLGMVLEEGEEKEREEGEEKEREEEGEGGEGGVLEKRGEREGAEEEDGDVPDAEDNPSLNEPPAVGVATTGDGMRTQSEDESGSGEGTRGLRRRGRGLGAGVGPRRAGGVFQESEQRVDANYFGSYGGLSIHREMLGDKVRTEAYQRALEGNPWLMQGAVVLDVGCGTGILSLFAARAGAKRVVGVDASPQIVAVARQVARDNGYLKLADSAAGAGDVDAGRGVGAIGGGAGAPRGASGVPGERKAGRPVVSFVNCKVEELPLHLGVLGCTAASSQPGTAGSQLSDQGAQASGARAAGASNGKGGEGGWGDDAALTGDLAKGSVDVIVSEWMGYGLLCESMLQSVIHARDTWLKPGGAILPDIAKIFAAGFGVGGTSLGFWRDVYGFSYESVGQRVQEDYAQDALVHCIEGTDLVTTSCLVQTIDLCTATAESTYFTVSFNLHPADPPAGASGVTAGAAGSGTGCYGVVLWFDTDFSPRFCAQTPVVLSTTPFGPPTHWQQVLLTFRTPIFLATGAPPAETPSQAGPLPADPSSSPAPAPSPVPAPVTPTATGATGASIEGGSGGLAAPGRLWHTAGGPVGSPQQPAQSIHCRLSVGPGLKYRSLDFSIEVTAVGAHGQREGFPAQIFTL